MSEFGSPASTESHKDDDDDSKEASSSSHKPVIAKSFGELIVKKDEADSSHETFFNRHEQTEEPKSPLERLEPTESSAETLPDALEAEEEDPSLGELTNEESRIAAAERANTSRQGLKTEKESVAENSPEAMVVAAHEALLDGAEDKLEEDPSLTPEAAYEAAFNEVAEELGVAETEPATDEAPAEVEPPQPTAEAIDEDDEEDPVAPTTAGSGGGTGTPPPPPTPPTPPTPPLGMPHTSFGPGGYSGGPTSVTTTHNSLRQNTPTQEQLDEAERRGENRGLVVGGLLGYLVGRRRGRIKTEKRLLPVQEKLEKQVTGLQKEIGRKEHRIRALAEEKARVMSETERQVIVERLRPKAKERSEKEPKPAELKRYIPEQQTAESATDTALEIMKKQPEALMRANHLELVQKMNHNELLLTSEKVLIDGTSLRTIYESRQVTEPGLRRILTEYLGGGDIKKALSKELLVKQLTYERDPQLRDAVTVGYSDTARATAAEKATAAANGLLPPVPASTAGAQAATSSEPAVTKPVHAIPLPDGRSVSGTQKQKNKAEKVIVGSWAAVIVILAVVAAVLLLK
jgi:hypothetical protein